VSAGFTATTDIFKVSVGDPDSREHQHAQQPPRRSARFGPAPTGRPSNINVPSKKASRYRMGTRKS